jgi:hypothetical protein
VVLAVVLGGEAAQADTVHGLITRVDEQKMELVVTPFKQGQKGEPKTFKYDAGTKLLVRDSKAVKPGQFKAVKLDDLKGAVGPDKKESKGAYASIEVTEGKAASITFVADAKAELLARWNLVAAGVKVGSFDFRWEEFDRFPHPTYKGGSAEAYGTFAKLLVALFEKGDNFEFLAASRLFAVEFQYKFPSGQVSKLGSLAQLADRLSQPNALGGGGGDNRKALKAFSDRIQALAKNEH